MRGPKSQENEPFVVTFLILLLSLFGRLRSPKSPDEEADMGSHEFSYAVYPHSGTMASISFKKIVIEISIVA